jgi:hypothetical protein
VNYRKCDECGLVQQTPVPADVTPFYENYPVHQKKIAAVSLGTHVDNECLLLQYQVNFQKKRADFAD